MTDIEFRSGHPDGRTLKTCGQCRSDRGRERQEAFDAERRRKERKRRRPLTEISGNTRASPLGPELQLEQVRPALNSRNSPAAGSERSRVSSIGSMRDYQPLAEAVQARPRREQFFDGLIGNRVQPESDYLGPFNLECPRCHAVHWRDELRNSKVIAPMLFEFSLCCSNGEVVPGQNWEVPEYFEYLFTDQGQEAKEFRRNINAYNNAVAFTSCLSGSDTRLDGTAGITSFTAQGELKHVQGPIEPDDTYPGYAQCYFFDADAAVEYRHGLHPSLNRQVLKGLDEAIRLYNCFYPRYLGAHEYIARLDEDRTRAIEAGQNAEQLANVWASISPKLSLIVRAGSDKRRENNPIVHEIAGVIPDDQSCTARREIVLICRGPEAQRYKLERIYPSHAAYFPLHYVLLFPVGKGGWTTGARLQRDGGVQNSMTLNRWLRYQLHIRPAGTNILHRGCRLFQKFCVDGFCSVDQLRLYFLQSNQLRLKAFLYSTGQDALAQGTSLNDIGRWIILPATHLGSDRFMQQLYHDSMTIVRKYGKPALFITFTANPRWKEIGEGLLPGQTVQDRPDLVARVFELKKKRFLSDLKVIYGRYQGVVWTVEYQKRGLPHIHVLLFLHPEDHFLDKARVDEVVCAELPTPDQDPSGRLRAIVEAHLIHGPCGNLNPKSPCMIDKGDGRGPVCTKKYPKLFSSETVVNSDGYPTYRRRQNGAVCFRKVNGIDVQLDNRWVVPYNPFTVLKYDAHINTEVCQSVQAIKYIHKYLYKGEDRTTMQIETERDEIKQYLSGRYISPIQAVNRIFSYHSHQESPAVQRLNVHLPGEETAYISEEDINNGVQFNPNTPAKSTLLDWFTYNRANEDGRGLLYQDFPEKYRWVHMNGPVSYWTVRKKAVFSLGRIRHCTPKEGERFYLRLLLTRVPGALGFEQLRTVNGHQYPTFKEACEALHLIRDEGDWVMYFTDLCCTEAGFILRRTFVSALVNGDILSPRAIWDQFQTSFCDDLPRRIQELPAPNGDVHLLAVDYGLFLLQQELNRFDQDLETYRLPLPVNDWSSTEANGQAPDQARMEQERQRLIGAEMVPKLNIQQRFAYDTILNSVVRPGPASHFFVHGPAGTGKTFLYKALYHAVIGQGKKVLCVASSGVAALLLPLGVTSHSRFKIPLVCTEHSICALSKESAVASVLRETDLIIWDEVPMQHKFNFYAVDRTLQDICNNSTFFGGISTVFGGDFAQTTPVVPKANRAGQVRASIRFATFWPGLQQLFLTENMRIKPGRSNFLYSQWIGNMSYDPRFYGTVKLPPVIAGFVQDLSALVGAVYPRIHEGPATCSAEYFRTKAILTPTNDAVCEINSVLLQQVSGEIRTLLAEDSADLNSSEQGYILPTEFLNSLNPTSLPPSRLDLKIGVPIMLIRNLDPKGGLCNGSRAIVLQIRERSIKIRLLGGEFDGEEHFLFRIKLDTHATEYPFILSRRQYPIRLCFAMTINKAQGQSLDRVGIDLRRPCFSHGQLYVALSRVKDVRNLTVLLSPVAERQTENVVFPEVLLKRPELASTAQY